MNYRFSISLYLPHNSFIGPTTKTLPRKRKDPPNSRLNPTSNSSKLAFKSMTNAQLREICSANGLTKGGNKKNLLDRIHGAGIEENLNNSDTSGGSDNSFIESQLNDNKKKSGSTSPSIGDIIKFMKRKRKTNDGAIYNQTNLVKLTDEDQSEQEGQSEQPTTKLTQKDLDNDKEENYDPDWDPKKG